MKYKVIIDLKEGEPREFTTTAKTRVSLKLKINSYMERKGIDEDRDVEGFRLECLGEPFDENDVEVYLGET